MQKKQLIIFIILLLINHTALTDRAKYNTFTDSPLLDSRISQESTEKASKIIPLLTDNDINVRLKAIDALSQLKANEAIPNIIPILKDDNHNVSSYATEALIQLNVEPVVIIPLLQDNDSYVRSSAMVILAQLDAKEAIPYIIPLLNDRNWNIHREAIMVLTKLDSNHVVKYRTIQFFVMIKQYPLQATVFVMWMFFLYLCKIKYSFKNTLAQKFFDFIAFVLSLWAVYIIICITLYLMGIDLIDGFVE